MSAGDSRWSVEQVLALAPDAASREAGALLAAPGPWSGTGTGRGAVWGECGGSGSRPYRTVVDVSGGGAPGCRCSCPSRKFPCKHALGLLLLWSQDSGAVRHAPESVPDWAESWLTGRRDRPGQSARDEGRAAAPADPEAARRRAERRAARIAAGATELEQRLADLLRGGLADAAQSGSEVWDETAARMVDAQAPGLAARVRELGAIPGSGAGWPSRLLAECALLHLLDQAFLGVDGLPEPLAATVRSRVGLTTESAGLLADRDAVVRDRWLVLGQHDSAEGKEGRLTARRIWLYGERTGRPALLLSYAAAGRTPEPALPVGSSVDAGLAYHPGTPALRAALGECHAAPGPGGTPPGVGVHGALAAYGAALCGDPWLDGWPVVLSDVVPVPVGEGWQLADATGDLALPVTAAAGTRSGMWRLAAVSGGEPVTVFGECGHRGFTPYTAWSDTAIPLTTADSRGGTA